MSDDLVAWDSCIILDAIQRTPGRWEQIAPMINLAASGKLKIVISTLSVAEVHYLRLLGEQGVDQAAQTLKIEQWLDNTYLAKRAADYGTCKIAAEACRTAQRLGKRLLPPDAIIVATALRHGADTLVTIDGKRGQSLLALDGKFPVHGGGFLRICQPQAWCTSNAPQLPFPDQAQRPTSAAE